MSKVGMDRNQVVGLPKKARLMRQGEYVYAFIPTYFWDTDKKRGNEKREYIGKVINGQFVPNLLYQERQKNKKRNVVKAASLFDFDKSYGASCLLLETAKACGLMEDLSICYGQSAKMLLSLAIFQILRNSQALYRFESFLQGTCLPVDEPVSSPGLSEWCIQMGQDTERLNHLFRRRLLRLDESEYLSYDSTKIASQSRQVTDVCKGPSKNGGYETQIGLALLYGHQSKMPVMFRRFAGNVADVSTIADLVMRWDHLDIGKKITVVLDRGYCSHANFRHLVQSKTHFIVATKINLKMVSDAIEKHMASYWDAKNQIPGTELFGIKTEISLPDKTKLNLYSYLSNSRLSEEVKSFFEEIDQYARDWESGYVNEKSSLLRYFKKPEKEPGKCSLERDHDVINQAIRYFGFFGFISDLDLDTQEILSIYRARDGIEKCFGSLKGHAAMTTTRGHTNETVNARLLIAFISVTLISYLLQQMSQEKQIKKEIYGPLIEEKSLTQLLDELEQVRIYGTKKGKYWLSEITKKQRHYLQRLGMDNIFDSIPTYN